MGITGIDCEGSIVGRDYSPQTVKKYDFIESQKYGVNYAEFKATGGRILSPSSLAKSMTNPAIWYADFMGTNPDPFTGNESTIRGSLIHAAIEAHYLNQEIDYVEVAEWLRLKSIYIPDIIGLEDRIISDTKVALSCFRATMPTTTFASPKPVYMEHYMEFKLTPQLMFAGTADAIFENLDGIASGTQTFTMIDWKSSKAMKSSIGDYRGQLYAYQILFNKSQKQRIIDMSEEECKSEYIKLYGVI